MEGKNIPSESENNATSLPFSNVLTTPLQYVKSIVPGYKNSSKENDPTGQESMGDKLKKKRMKTKRRSQGMGHKHTVHDIDKHHKNIGCNRSVVRYIGSNVPMGIQYQRDYLDMIDNSRKAFMTSASSFISTNFDQVRQQVDQVKHHVVPSLADLGQIMWEDLMFTENNDGVKLDESAITFEAHNHDEDEKNEETSKSDSIEAVTPTKEQPKQDSAKISALEDELAKLRAQIAMIVSAQQAPSTPQTTKVAIVAPTPIMAPPPPPPPPPPLPSFKAVPTINISKPPIKKTKSLDNKTEGAPDMNQVLKGLASVKLKSVDIQRSPGGTPMKKNEPREDSNNHADIIARALRQKFKNTNIYDSPERNVYSPDSGFTPTPPRMEKTKLQAEGIRPIPAPRPKPRPRTEKKSTSNATPLNLSYNH